MGVFEQGGKGTLHFHALIYVPENGMIGEIVEKKECCFTLILVPLIKLLRLLAIEIVCS